MKLEYSRQIFKKYQIQNCTKIRTLRAELFHVDGRTDGRRDRRTDGHDEDNSRFSQF